MAGSGSQKIGLLDVVIEERPARIYVQLLGRSEARDSSKELDPLFTELLARAEAERKTLELRFERLEHFNSATVGALLRMINSARNRLIQLDLCYDASLRWQSVSFEALNSAVRTPGSALPPTIRIRSIERAV